MVGRVHFRDALPTEKWSEMACFLALLRIASRKGNVDSARIIKEWRERRLARLTHDRESKEACHDYR